MVKNNENPGMGSPVSVIVIIILTMFMAFITAAVVRLNLEPITNSSINERIKDNQKVLTEIRGIIYEIRDAQAKAQQH